MLVLRRRILALVFHTPTTTMPGFVTPQVTGTPSRRSSPSRHTRTTPLPAGYKITPPLTLATSASAIAEASTLSRKQPTIPPGYRQLTVTFNSGSNTMMKVFCGFWGQNADYLDDSMMLEYVDPVKIGHVWRHLKPCSPWL